LCYNPDQWYVVQEGLRNGTATRMSNQKSLKPLVLGILSLCLLACGPCGLLSATVPTPPHPVVVSTEAAGLLESRVEQTVEGQPGQPFILTMSDDEVTSLAATELAKYDEVPVAEPRIWFSQGRVHGTGRLVNVLPVETSVYIVASASVQDGKLQVEIEEATAGSLPLPASVLDVISQSISETVDELQLHVDVTGLEIREGEATLYGTLTEP
jgi:hypothetical protein